MGYSFGLNDPIMSEKNISCENRNNAFDFFCFCVLPCGSHFLLYEQLGSFSQAVKSRYIMLHHMGYMRRVHGVRLYSVCYFSVIRGKGDSIDKKSVLWSKPVNRHPFSTST